MAIPACLHDGVSATDVLVQDGVGLRLAEEEHDLGVALAGGDLQSRLVIVIERGTGSFVPE